VVGPGDGAAEGEPVGMYECASPHSCPQQPSQEEMSTELPQQSFGRSSWGKKQYGSLICAHSVGDEVGAPEGSGVGPGDGDGDGATVGPQYVPQHLFAQICEYGPPAQHATSSRGPEHRSMPLKKLCSVLSGQLGADVGERVGWVEGAPEVGGVGALVGALVGDVVGAASAQQRTCRASLTPAHRDRRTGPPSRTAVSPPSDEPSMGHCSALHTSALAVLPPHPASCAAVLSSSSWEHNLAPALKHAVYARYQIVGWSWHTLSQTPAVPLALTRVSMQVPPTEARHRPSPQAWRASQVVSERGRSVGAGVGLAEGSGVGGAVVEGGSTSRHCGLTDQSLLTPRSMM
jgi:hypothetical protein